MPTTGVIAIRWPVADLHTLSGAGAGLGLEAYTIATGVPIDNANIVWSSEDNAILTVSSTGFVNTVAGGTTNVVATTTDGLYTATYDITVINAPPAHGGGGGGAVGVTAISIFWPGNSGLSSFTLSGVGAGLGLEAYTDTNVGITYDATWTTSNSNVAVVSSGGFISAVGGGNCTITASYATGGQTYTDTYAITVINAPVIGPTDGGPVTGVLPITCSIPGLYQLYGVGSGLQLYSSTVPVDANDPTLVWTSSNTNVATINSSGFINTVGGGWTEISVRANGDATKVAPNKYTIFVDAPYINAPPTVSTTTLSTATSSSLIQSLKQYDNATAASIITGTSTSSTSISKTEQVATASSQAMAVVVDKSGLSNTIQTQGQVVAVDSSTSVNVFSAANPNVTKLGIAVEKVLDAQTSAVTEVKLIAVKLDSAGNVIPSDVNNSGTFDTVNVTLPRSAYLTIGHTDGTTTSTFGYVDFTSVATGQLFTFANGATLLVVTTTVSTVTIIYRGPFSETSMTPSSSNPGGTAATPSTIILPPGANGSSVPCFPAGTRILTAAGYKAVETITQGDKVVTADGRAVNAAVHKRHFTVATKETAPYRIRANTFANQPNEICLSPHHALLSHSNTWQIPEFAAKLNSGVQQYGVGEPVTYYHIETANYFSDNLVAEGCVVESFCGKAAASIPKGTPLFKFNAAKNGFTRYSPSKAVAKKH